jgi:TIR domain-containing protein
MPEVSQVCYEVYLLQAERDEAWVEQQLAKRLKSKAAMNPYFFKWESIPGDSRLLSMQNGFDESLCCAVCLGEKVLDGLDEMMQQAAIIRKANDSKYRVIPVILPGGDSVSISGLLAGLLVDPTTVDFRAGTDFEEQFHRLVSAIKGKKPGPWPSEAVAERDNEKYTKTLLDLFAMVSAAEQKGLPKDEAVAFRKDVFETIKNQAIEVALKRYSTEADPLGGGTDAA